MGSEPSTMTLSPAHEKFDQYDSDVYHMLCPSQSTHLNPAVHLWETKPAIQCKHIKHCKSMMISKFVGKLKKKIMSDLKKQTNTCLESHLFCLSDWMIQTLTAGHESKRALEVSRSFPFFSR